MKGTCNKANEDEYKDDNVLPEWKGTRDNAKEYWQDEASVDEEAKQDGEEVVTKFDKFTSNILK